MSANSPTFYSVQYASAVKLVSQQMRSKIAHTFSQGTFEGKAATQIDLIGVTEVQERTTRFAPIVPANIPHSRPWIFPSFFDAAELFDSIDKLKMNASPESEYVQALQAAMNRKMDTVAVAAFWADRLVGENGTTTEIYSTAQDIGVNVGGTTSGLNVEKLQAGLEMLKTADVDLDVEQVHAIISPRQERNLMNEIEVISSDYTRGAVMESGQLKRFLGIEFAISNRLSAQVSTNYRMVPLYTKGAMSFGTWGGGPQTNVSMRNDLAAQPWQCYVQAAFGAARREPNKLVRILCSEA